MSAAMRILVTGAAGFIGFHVAGQLLERGDHVVGVDDLNAYYSVALKRARLDRLAHPRFTFIEGDVADESVLARALEAPVDAIVHFAAQVGVRHSSRDPQAYLHSNLVGFGRVIDAARVHAVSHFVYASSSSVYGAATSLPLREDRVLDQPLNLYAATKRANELIAYSYSQVHRLPTTGLRLFTVYGPWGRPDMAVFGFADRIQRGLPLVLFAGGTPRRDFTFIDDAASSILGILDRPAGGPAPARVVNVGSGRQIEVRRVVELLEASLCKKAIVEVQPLPPSDMKETWADIAALGELLGERPLTPFETGVERFVAWYLDTYSR